LARNKAANEHKLTVTEAANNFLSVEYEGPYARPIGDIDIVIDFESHKEPWKYNLLTACALIFGEENQPDSVEDCYLANGNHYAGEDVSDWSIATISKIVTDKANFDVYGHVKYARVWAHFGGGFDFAFLLGRLVRAGWRFAQPYIYTGSILQHFRVFKVIGKHEVILHFFDSFSILQASVFELAPMHGLQKDMGDVTYNAKRAISDCRIVLNSLKATEKAFDFIPKFLLAGSLEHTLFTGTMVSRKIAGFLSPKFTKLGKFSRNLWDGQCIQSHANSTSANTIEYWSGLGHSRRGGFTFQKIRGVVKLTEGDDSHSGTHVWGDINSAYPYAMTKPLPTNFSHYYRQPHLDKLYRDERDGYYIFACGSFFIPDSCTTPIIPIRDKGHTLYPTGWVPCPEFVTWDVIKYILDNGGKFSPWHALVFHKAVILKEFAETLFTARKTVKKSDPAKAHALKIMLNRLFGSTLRGDTFSAYSVTTQDEHMSYAFGYANQPQIGAAITNSTAVSIARTNPDYCDTDAILTPSRSLAPFIQGDDLGQIKKEYPDGSYHLIAFRKFHVGFHESFKRYAFEPNETARVPGRKYLPKGLEALPIDANGYKIACKGLPKNLWVKQYYDEHNKACALEDPRAPIAYACGISLESLGIPSRQFEIESINAMIKRSGEENLAPGEMWPGLTITGRDSLRYYASPTMLWDIPDNGPLAFHSLKDCLTYTGFYPGFPGPSRTLYQQGRPHHCTWEVIETNRVECEDCACTAVVLNVKTHFRCLNCNSTKMNIRKQREAKPIAETMTKGYINSLRTNGPQIKANWKYDGNNIDFEIVADTHVD
jgi:hypothetical protein